MKPKARPILATATLSLALVMATLAATGAGRSDERSKPEAPPPGPRSVEEARAQAKLLHETIHTTLQVVHSRYYREDEGLPIPSLTLETVFEELTRTRNLDFHWLAVDANPMSVDHKPRDPFEEAAVAALKSGQDSFERVEEDSYRHAGAVTLSSQCLKCHLPNRTSTKPRTASLVITVPLKAD